MADMEGFMIFWVSVLFICSAGCMLFVICAIVHSAKLYSYLKEKDDDRWCEFTSRGYFGLPRWNGIRWLKYVYSDRDNDDAMVLRLKRPTRAWMGAALLWILADVVIAYVLISGVSASERMGRQ